jgi:hypothetical protein
MNLFEGRKEDVQASLNTKFPYDASFIGRVLNTDPTGGKYVEYIGKRVEDVIPRVTGSADGGLNFRQSEALEDLFNTVIPWFNNNYIRFTENDIRSAAETYEESTGNKLPNIETIVKSPKDINVYLDPVFIKYVAKIVEDRKSEKEKEKEIKSQVDKIYEDSDVLVVSPHSHEASCYYGANTKWCTTTRHSAEHFKKYSSQGKLYYFLNKKIGIKYALFKNNDKSIEIYDQLDHEVKSEELRRKFPNQQDVIDEIIDSSDLYKTLRLYAKGQATNRDVLDSDNAIYQVFEATPPGTSRLIIDFEEDDELFKVLDISEEDSWFLKAIMSSYGSYEFMDSYQSEQDFKDGYIIYYDLNDENKEKLSDISSIILPNEIFDLSNEDFKVKLSKKLLDVFDSEMDYIISDWTGEKNIEIRTTAERDIDNEFNKAFESIGFKMNRSYDRLETTIGNMVMWYIRLQSEKLDAISLFKKIIEDQGISIGGWSDNMYEYQDDENFDKVSFNNAVERQLDSILEKLEDNTSIKEYINLREKVLSKFSIDKWYKLPVNKEISFKIEGFDTDDLKIKVRLQHPEKGMVGRKLSYDNFMSLLYQPELFKFGEV